MVRVFFILIAMLGCFGLAASAQSSAPSAEKKTDFGKSKENDPAKAKETPKAKAPEKSSETAKELPKSKITLDKLKTPSGAVVVVVDELLKAMELVPRGVFISVEEYQALQEQILSLKRQLKVDKKLPHSCKLVGKQDGDFLALRVDFAFSTDQPKTTAFLGLLGAHLMDAGELDQQVPILDFTKEGFVVRVEKPGMHQLSLNLRMRIDAKKSSAGATEYGLQLGLPGAAVTTLALELPPQVKELRWNDTLEKTKIPGRWQLGLDKSDMLSLAWKEPIAVTGQTPLAKVDGQIKVRVDETHVNIEADLFLEDLRFQTREWHLLLPPQAKMEVKPPGGLTYDRIGPDGKNPYHTLRLQEATAERWQVIVTLRLPRPHPGVRLPIGPFTVLGAYQQQGTISVQMPLEASLGQRLVFHRQGEIHQLKNSETEATFQYVAPPTGDKNVRAALAAKAPLELEWRYEKNQLETKVEHFLKVKTVKQGWEIEATTFIKVKALFSGINAIELKLPLPRSRGISLLGTAMPGIGFPGVLPWGGLWNPYGMPWLDADSEETTITDNLRSALKLFPQDAFGKTRVAWGQSPTKEITLELKNTYRTQGQRLRLELPRPIYTQDRGAKIVIQTDDQVELLQGPAGAEEPVPEKHHFDWTTDLSPSLIDLAWRPYRREIVAESLADVTIHEHTAQVRQAIRFSLPAGADSKIRLHVPSAIDKLTILAGAEITNQNLPAQTVWIKPTTDSADKIEIVLQYDLALAAKPASEDALPSARVLTIPFVWPTHVSRKETKVRVWTQTGGVKVRLTDDMLSRGNWKERGIEVVKEKEEFPALVLQSSTADPQLSLQIEDSSPSPLAVFLAERGLIQFQMNDDGSQQCKARFLLRKINTHHLDVELPIPLSRFRDRPSFFLGKHQIKNWKTLDATEKTVRLNWNPDLILLPALLEISYVIPPETLQNNGNWRTTLFPPQFRSEVVTGHLRWQLSLPAPMIACSLGRQVRVDTQWTLQGWLFTPEPSVTAADLETWLTAKGTAQAAAPVSFAFADQSLQPHVIYHLPRTWWLLVCSSLLLIVALAIYLSPLPRPVFWLFLLSLAVSVLTVGVVWPAALGPLLFGCQPGMALLALFVGVHWFWHDYSRRRLLFLPAFSRLKPSSTLMRPGSSKRPREASTVDAPAAASGAAVPGSPSGSP